MPGADQTAAGELVVNGNTWTYPWREPRDSRVMHFRVINTFVDKATIEFRSDYSEDGAHWTATARRFERRIS